jgi:hypothetical protein
MKVFYMQKSSCVLNGHKNYSHTLHYLCLKITNLNLNNTCEI